MKTTIDIPDALLDQVKRLAQERSTTLRALVEFGLRQVLREHQRKESFVLRDARVGGNGLSDEFRGVGWDSIRDAAYEGRGS